MSHRTMAERDGFYHVNAIEDALRIHISMQHQSPAELNLMAIYAGGNPMNPLREDMSDV